MKYAPIDPALFVENRARLTALLEGEKPMAVVCANDILPTNADGVLPFRQNSDLFFLSGIDQEESILILFPGAADEERRELLFVRETNDQVMIWEGAKLTKEQAAEVSGIEKVYWLGEFERIFRELVMEAGSLYLNSNEHIRADIAVDTRERRFIARCQRDFPLHTYRRLAPLLHRLRSVKSPAEVALLQTAIDITEKGYRRALEFIRPGVTEYEIEAEYLHEFVRNRSRGFAFIPIIASGVNNCVLHYLDNDQVCQNGDLVLMDVGAEYANYNADLTRTVPVNGRYSERQRAVYEAVLRVVCHCHQILRPGVIAKEYQKEVGRTVESELIGLGLLDADEVKEQDPDRPLYKKYFMHGTSHHLGLDVHDVGAGYLPVEPGMVFTIEPGIYIRDEGFGVRIENDVLIGEDANTDLMASVPVEPDEIEEIMNG